MTWKARNGVTRRRSSTDVVLVNLASRAFCERQHALSKISRSEREDEEDEDESLYDAFRDAPIVEFIVDECIPFANVVELDTLVSIAEHDREVDGDFERAGSRASFRYRRRDDATRRFVSKRWGKIRRGDERELLRGDGVRKRGKEK